MEQILKTLAEPNEEFNGILDVAPEAVQKHLSELVLVDVRRPDEYDGELGHIPGAALIVLDTIPERFAEIPKDREVVLICRSGRRSAQASEFLKRKGLSKHLQP
ncbi:MAG: rhodanese-like domain-containing protein [Bdellovibrionales bacterium]